MNEIIIYGIGLALSFYMAYNLGANDAANPTACTVGAGVLNIKKAVMLFSIFVAIGALLHGSLVMETVGRGIAPEDAVLFETEQNDMKPYLNEEVFPEKFRKDFEREGFEISENITVQIEEENKSWTLFDEIENREYKVNLIDGYFEVRGRRELGIVGAFTSILAVCIWVTLASWLGLPISTTHSIVGAVIGYSIFVLGGFNSSVLLMVLIAMIISPIISLVLAMALLPRMEDIMGLITNRIGLRKSTRLLNGLVVFALCFSAYSFGANDIANATGVFITATEEVGMARPEMAGIVLALLGSFGVAVGGFSLGSRVIETAGRRITSLNPLRAFTAEFSNALIVMLFTVLPTALLGFEGGAPVSTTHVSIGTIIGVGLAGKGVGVNKKTVIKIVGSWGLTLPISFFLSIGLYLLAGRFLPV